MKKLLGHTRIKSTKNNNSRDLTAHEEPPSENGHPVVIRDGECGEKKEENAFWTRDKDGKDKPSYRDKDKGREKNHNEAELTRTIGYLTATALENWALVLEVCDRASASGANAREAVRTLRRDLKYGEPLAQLSATRVSLQLAIPCIMPQPSFHSFGIMLRNSSELFISHSMARKFLDTLINLLASPQTSPVVRERLLDVVAAASYACGSVKNERGGFRGLWRRMKPLDRPDGGIPFNTYDSMFNPPLSSRHSQYDIPVISLGDAPHLTLESRGILSSVILDTPTPQLPPPGTSWATPSPDNNVPTPTTAESRLELLPLSRLTERTEPAVPKGKLQDGPADPGIFK